jgi:chromosome segregation ATPase
MSDKLQLLADARKFAAQFGAFVKAAEMLGAVGSIEQAEQEARSRLAAVEAEIAARRQAADGIEETAAARCAALRADADAYRAAKEAEGNLALSGAKTEADKIVSAASGEAAGLVAAAKAAALADTQASADARNELAALKAEIAKTKREHEAVLAAHGEASAKLDDVNTEISRLKSRL